MGVKKTIVKIHEKWLSGVITAHIYKGCIASLEKKYGSKVTKIVSKITRKNKNKLNKEEDEDNVKPVVEVQEDKVHMSQEEDVKIVVHQSTTTARQHAPAPAEEPTPPLQSTVFTRSSTRRRRELQFEYEQMMLGQIERHNKRKQSFEHTAPPLDWQIECT